MSLGSISEALPYAIRIGFPLCAVVYIATGRAGRWPIFTWFLIATSIKTWATSPGDANVYVHFLLFEFTPGWARVEHSMVREHTGPGNLI